VCVWTAIGQWFTQVNSARIPLVSIACKAPVVVPPAPQNRSAMTIDFMLMPARGL